MLEPRLTPERTSVGFLSVMIWATPIITQSVGVPASAKRFSSTLRRRSGSVSVNECEAPDCSVSGATTHTSSEISRAIFSSTARPGACMPSSFVTRMRCDFVMALPQPSGSVALLRPQVPLCLMAARPSQIPKHPKTIAEHLRKRRLELGMSQREAAKRLGVSPGSLCSWESGRKIPGLSKRVSVRAFLGYDPYPQNGETPNEASPRFG